MCGGVGEGVRESRGAPSATQAMEGSRAILTLRKSPGLCGCTVPAVPGLGPLEPPGLAFRVVLRESAGGTCVWTHRWTQPCEHLGAYDEWPGLGGPLAGPASYS